MMHSTIRTKKERNKRQEATATLCAVAFWLLLWHFLSVFIGSDILLVSPLDVAKTLWTLLFTPQFLATVGYSAIRILGGFFLALLLGVLLAWISARFEPVEILLRPITAVIKAVPVASFIILVLLWFSSRNLSIIISFLMVFPVIYTNTLKGIQNTDRKLLETAAVFRISRLKRIVYIDLPAVLPFFVSACSVSLGLCWKSGIAAEVIGIPGGSIGEQLYNAKIYLQTGELLAWTVVIVAVSILFEKLFMALLHALMRKLGIGGAANGGH